MGAQDRQPDVKRRLEFGLQQLTKAPLKPQQRLFLLRVHLLPSLCHQLILDTVTQNTLGWLDRMVRKVVKGWLRLPHDLPKSMFHARVANGGLGIPMLCSHMRIAKKDRMNRLVALLLRSSTIMQMSKCSSVETILHHTAS